MKPIHLFYMIWLNCLFTACTVSKKPSYAPTNKIAPALLKEDLQVMEQTLRNNHPSLTWYSSEEIIAASFQRANEMLTDSMNEIEFRNLISETLFPIRCGHTSVRFSKKYYEYIRKHQGASFPLGLKIMSDSSLVVTYNMRWRDSVIKTGTIIKSIDGLSAEKIIDSLFPLISIDGNSKNFSYQNLSNSFPSYYNNRFGVQKNYQVEFLNAKGEVEQKTINTYFPKKDSLDRKPFVVDTSTTQMTELTEHQKEILRLRNFHIDSTKTYGILRLNSFGPGLRRSFLKKSFRQLKKKKIENLVIDVRNNGGGLIKKALFLTRRIHQEPFVFADSIYSIHHKIKSEAKIYKRLLFNVGLCFFTKKVTDSMFHFRYFNTKKENPSKHNFKGNVYVLTGGFSFSATTLFAASVKASKNVTLVGEETGGGYYGNNGVFIAEMVLPHSKMRVRIPLFRIVNNKNFPKNGSGVIPDIEVKSTAESIRLNKDPKMDRVIELIMHQKK